MIRFLLFSVIAFMTSQTFAFGQEREWQMDAADQDVFMVFGVAGSNDVGISFWCKIGGKEVSVFTPLPPSAQSGHGKVPLDLQIGNSHYRLVATRTNADAQNTAEAKLKPQNTILEKLQAAEHFSTTIAKHTVTYPLAGADFAGLLKLCNQN